MLKFITRTSRKAGQSPGTLTHIGAHRPEPVTVECTRYDRARLQTQTVDRLSDCLPSRDAPGVTWINLTGVHELEVVETIGRHFDIHPLVLEDIVHTGQRPKLEESETYLYIVLKMIRFCNDRQEVKAEQVSLILTHNAVVSFQEVPGDVFDPVCARLRNDTGRLRKKGADYLCYALIDAIVDNYFLVLEKIGDAIEALEEELITRPQPETLQAINRLRGDMIFLRRSVWPLRDVIMALERAAHDLLDESNTPFFRDVYDHTVQVIETAETFRDVVAGMLDMYLSSLSNKMNEVMKVLTVIATIFIPMTFIAGMYGMNFKHMPELDWPWAYPAVWAVVLAVGAGMVVYFRRRRWL